MIYQNAYWYDIEASDLRVSGPIAGKWLYFDETPKIHALVPRLDHLVEAGRIRAAKVARKIPEYDPFPEKPCVLCIFTSSDPDEKKQVKELLKREFDISVVAWKSDAQTSRDWQEGGWLRIQADINQLRRDIRTGYISDGQATQERIRVLTQELDQILYGIDDPNQQLEIQINRFHEWKKRDAESSTRHLGQDAVLERIANLENLISEMTSSVKADDSKFEETRSSDPQPPSEHARILFLTANALDTTRLRLDKEMREIEQVLRQAQFRDRFDIKHHWAVRVSDLQGYLLRYKPNIVHFSGHGSGSSEIILEDNSGNSHPVPSRALSKLFSVLKDNVQCVVLNACYSEKQAQAIAEHIDCVIGMSQAIDDLSTISFSTAFYQALGFGRDVRTAFELGCVQIDLENLGEHDTPRLLATRVDPSQVRFVSASSLLVPARPGLGGKRGI